MKNKTEKSKLISVRLSNRTLFLLEKTVRTHCFYKRNAVIENILNSVLSNFTETQIREMLRYWSHSGIKYTTEFKKSDEASSL